MSFRLEYLLVRKRHDDNEEKKRKRNEHAQDVGNKIKTNREKIFFVYSARDGQEKSYTRTETRRNSKCNKNVNLWKLMKQVKSQHIS